MERASEIGLMQEILGLRAQKSAFLDTDIAHSPIERYTSTARLDQERRALFHRRPVIAAHSSELAGANDFLTRDIMGLPVILVRDGAGAGVRAFLNVCRHRGARLEREGAGCKRVFTCPYHGWAYGNDGALRGVPQETQGFPDLPRGERGLRPLPVAEAFGFIWVIADQGASGPMDVAEWFGPLGADFNWLDFAAHRIAAEDRIEIAANWKLLAEGGIEAYHFRVAHAATIAPYFPDNLSTYQMFGPHMRSVLPRNSIFDLREQPEADWSIRRDANLLYTALPSSQFLVQQDHFIWISFEPLAPGRTALRLATMVPKDAPDTGEMARHWAQNHAITMATLMEDFELGEQIQSGFASRGNPSHLFGRFEGALNRLNLAVEDEIKAAGMPPEF